MYVGGSGPGDYSNIQDAIDNASSGDTVFVYNGTYYENIVINGSINLVGEDKYDGTNSGWLGPKNSGETVEASHMWTEEGKYNIKVNARDSYGELSEWSDPLAVAMVK